MIYTIFAPISYVVQVCDARNDDQRTTAGNKKYSYNFFHFNLKLLLTTLTELSAIAAPAIIGFNKNPLKGNKIPAASGIPMRL